MAMWTHKTMLQQSLILILAIISTVSSQCCDFESDISDWESTQWQKSSVTMPDLTFYPEFVSTQPSANYVWLQDKSGTVNINIDVTIQSRDTELSFDYYYDTTSASGDYLHFYLVINQLKKFELTSITLPDTQWKHVIVNCDNSNGFCCGSLQDIPCTGTLEFVAKLDARPDSGLFAVDNIGQCATATTTTTTSTTITTSIQTPVTTRPTLPPPIPPKEYCCFFETDACGATSPSNDWYLSLALLPPVPVPPHGGQYLWTDQANSEVILWDLTDVSSVTTFTMHYYISGPGVTLSIQFLIPGTSACEMFQLTWPGADIGWVLQSFSFDKCCSYGFCDGQLALDVIDVTTPDPFVIAVDDTYINGGCHDSLPCCNFADMYACGFLNEDTTTNDWKWSGTDPPTTTIPPPPADAYFEYYELNDVPTVAKEVGLISQPLTIMENATFTLTFYADTPTTSSGSFLVLYFTDTDANIDTTLDYYKTSGGTWMTASVTCGGEHGSCCQGNLYCNGNIKFVAQVAANEGPVQFGIDSFEIGDSCEATYQ